MKKVFELFIETAQNIHNYAHRTKGSQDNTQKAFCNFSLFLFSCSTKKNTRVSRAYHNLTAHYNAYFNGKESYKEGIISIKENLQDDFSKILPVFIYDNPSSTSVSGQMERAIKKSIKVINLHSITAKPKRKRNKKTAKDKAFYAQKEYNKWIDDFFGRR